MRVAIQGCSHGELDSIYRSILALDRQQGKRTDVVLLCGDFQAVRNVADLSCIAMPDKYKRLGDFHHYYSGKRQAPYLTLVIGGNHEASNHLWELFHGGWLAPNIYYLGAAGCVEVGGLRIAGISGIYKKFDYTQGRHEQVPYDNSSVRSTYHTRAYDVARLKLLNNTASKPHIVLSHDWPNTIEAHGDVQALIKKKPFFKEEIQTKTLGSPPLMELLRHLEPLYWFAAHLHVRFAALYKHSGAATQVQSGRSAAPSNAPSGPSASAAAATEEVEEVVDDPRKEDAPEEAEPARVAHWGPRAKINPEQINIELSPSPEAEEAATAIEVDEEPPHEHVHQAGLGEGEEKEQEARVENVLAPEKGATRFLALSKCLPNHDFLQILDIEAPFDTDDSYSIKLAPPPSAPPTGPKSSQPPTPTSSASSVSKPEETRLPTFRHVPRWLAITRTTHAHLSLQKHQPALPAASDAQFKAGLEREEKWVEEELVKKFQANAEAGGQAQGQGQGGDTHPLAVARIQMFMPTAPATNTPAGGAPGPPPWYTNPQTVALCNWLGLLNKINAPPSAPAPGTFPGAPIAPQGLKRPRDSNGNAPAAGVAAQQQSATDEAAEIALIQAAARKAMLARKRAKGEDASTPTSASASSPAPAPASARATEDETAIVAETGEMVISEAESPALLEGEEEEEEVDEALGVLQEDREVMRLSDEDEEMDARWKEGTG